MSISLTVPVPRLNNHTFTQICDRSPVLALLEDKEGKVDKKTKNALTFMNKHRDRTKLDIQYSVTYRLPNTNLGRLGYGRYIGTLGALDEIPRGIRGTICGKFYKDKDIENCHPVILSQLARHININLPILEKYVNDRKTILDKICAKNNCSKAVAKEAILKAMYGKADSVDYKYDIESDKVSSSILKKLNDEMDVLFEKLISLNLFIDAYDTIGKTKKYNKKGSYLAAIAMTYEKSCLDSMILGYQSLGYKVDVPAKDGCQIRSLDIIPDEIDQKVEEIIFTETGFRHKIQSKEFESICDEDIASLIDSNIIDENIIVNEKYASMAFINMLGDNIVKEDGVVYIYNEDNGMWEHDVLQDAVAKHAEDLCFKQRVLGATNKVHSFAGSWKSVVALSNYITTLLPSSNYISSNSSASLGYLLFADGHYDIKNKMFIPGFDKKKVFTARINEPFFSERNTMLESELDQALFINPFRDIQVGKYLKHIIARSLCGHFQDKRFYAILGLPNCGKGTITVGLNNTFGKYMGEWNINNLKYNSKSGSDEAKKLSWLYPMRTVRCAFSNEGRMDHVGLDGNLIKTMASGGDSICMRQNFKDESLHVLPTTFFYFGNDMPKISPLDSAVQSRLRFIRFVKTFVNKPLSDCGPLEMPADMHIKDKLKTSEYKNALFWLIMDNYATDLMADPEAVKEETADNVVVDEVNLRAILEEEFEITGNDDDYVPCRQIIGYFQSLRLNLSDTKIGRELRNIGLKKIDKKVDGKKTVVYLGLKR